MSTILSDFYPMRDKRLVLGLKLFWPWAKTKVRQLGQLYALTWKVLVFLLKL